MLVVRVGKHRGLVSGLEQLLQIRGKWDVGGVDLARALSLLQCVMTLEDFAKYRGMVAPRQKQKQIGERGLADRVKN